MVADSGRAPAGEEQQSLSPAVRFIAFAAALIALVLFMVVGVVTVALPGCESCHSKTPGFAGPTASTAHARAEIECVACHVDTGRVLPRTKFGLYAAFGMWVRVLDPTATDAMLVRDAYCLDCHQEVLETTLDIKGVRIVHSSCAQGRSCVDCHSEVGHAEATQWPRVISMNDCTSCHVEQNVSIECETCHSGRSTTTRFAEPEFSVTHGPTWRETHGMGQMSSCSVCHAEDSCSRCHGPGVPHAAGFLLDHATISRQDGTECLSCHNEDFCFSCHLTEMPHPAEFAQTHSDVVEADGEGPCLRCHVESDCDTCHVKHVHPGGAVGNIPSPSRGDE